MPSSTPRSSIASDTSALVNERTTKPPPGSGSSSPSWASVESARRSGVRETPSRSESSISGTRSPGANAPSRTSSRRPSWAFTVWDPAPSPRGIGRAYCMQDGHQRAIERLPPRSACSRRVDLLTILMFLWFTPARRSGDRARDGHRSRGRVIDDDVGDQMGRRPMKRFARIAAPAWRGGRCPGLAIAASAGTSRTTGSTSPKAGQAVTNYLKYVHGTKGKADPKKSKVYIGWVNQQGGQVVIGGLATAGAQMAVKYVNAELGGIDGHPVAARDLLHQVDRGRRHDLRAEARRRQADLRHRDGCRRHRRAVAPRDDRRAPSRSSPASPSPRSTERRRPASSSSATARTSSCRSATTRRTSCTRRPRRSSTRTRPASPSRDR